MDLKLRDKYQNSGILKGIIFQHHTVAEKSDWLDTENETLIVLIKGRCYFSFSESRNYAERESVFTDKPYACYIPKGLAVSVEPLGSVELAVCKSQSDKSTLPAFITPDMIQGETRGKDGFTRKVYDIVDSNGPSERLVVGETINLPGNWSSFPPHKHDTIREGETRMEELYFFKLNPEDGFGFQRVYTEDESLDEAIVIKNNDIVLIPKGYHPVCVMPGYEIYYLWVLVGESKVLMPYTQGKYKWLMGK